jgi:hypothetical protein
MGQVDAGAMRFRRASARLRRIVGGLLSSALHAFWVLQNHYDSDKLFFGSGLCLRSFAAAVTGRPVSECDVSTYPKAWLGDEEHTHHAIDDARGYANLLVRLLGMSKEQTRER